MSFSYQYISSRKVTPVLHTAFYRPRIPVHLQDNAKSSASHKAEEMWGTEKELVAVTNCPTSAVAGALFWPASLLLAATTYPPSHLHADLRALFQIRKMRKMPKLKVHFSLSLFETSNHVTKLVVNLNRTNKIINLRICCLAPHLIVHWLFSASSLSLIALFLHPL